MVHAHNPRQVVYTCLQIMWWEEQAQRRLAAHHALYDAQKHSQTELDALFANISFKFASQINVTLVEEDRKASEVKKAQKLADLKAQQEVEAAKLKQKQIDVENKKEIKKEEDKLKNDLELKVKDLTSTLDKLEKEIGELKVANEKNEKAEKELQEKIYKAEDDKAELEEKKEVLEQKQKREKEEEQKKKEAEKSVFIKPSSKPLFSSPSSSVAPVVKPAEATTPAPSASAAASTYKSSVKTSACPDAVEAFEKNVERINWIKKNVKEMAKTQPKDVKNFITDAKMELRPKFGMLTNSKKQLISCRDAVKVIFQKAKSGKDEIVYLYILNLYAKLLIEQSESEAKVKLQHALPLAMLTILLWVDFPELGDFVIPRMIKKCPQLIGYYCPIDTEEGRSRMRWQHDPDTMKYETEDEYIGRLSGICAVWACMTQSKLANKTTTHPYNMGNSWRFMSRMLNKPKEEVSKVDHALVAAWWEMTALRFSEAFGKQGLKLLELAWNQWTDGYTDVSAMRLRGLGENWKSTGVIEHAWEPLK